MIGRLAVPLAFVSLPLDSQILQGHQLCGYAEIGRYHFEWACLFDATRASDQSFSLLFSHRVCLAGGSHVYTRVKKLVPHDGY